MDYKKEYDNICQKLMSAYNTTSFIEVRKAIEGIHPELGESEDERIRKWIISYLNSEIDGFLLPGDEECNKIANQLRKAIAYLENQKEQKTDAKSERVIKAARRVLNNWLDGTDCPDVSGDFAELEYAIREYDGEEKQNEPHYTKRNALFDKCVENCDPKVMKEISDKVDEMLGKEQKPNIEICPHSVKSKSYSETGYPIEDCDYGLEIALNILEDTLGKVQGFQTDDGIREHQTAIKAVKDAMKEQKPTDLPPGFYFIDLDGKRYYSKEFRYGDMKMKVVEKEPKPAEWSEEDEDYRSDVMWCIEQARKYAKNENDMGTTWCAERWIKSLRPQPHWKPSEEQMDALRITLDYMPDTFKPRCTLMTLQNDLKKLM